MNKNGGLTCIECKSVLFSLWKLNQHINENPTHHYYKHGDGEFVFYIKKLVNAGNND